MCVSCYLKTPTVHKVLSLIEDGHTIPCFIQFTIASNNNLIEKFRTSVYPRFTVNSNQSCHRCATIRACTPN